MNDELKKVPEHLASPIDNIFYQLSDVVCPLLKKLNFTPNLITTIGLFLGLLSIYFIHKGLYLVGVVFLWLCFFTDCLDGHFARKYNMETVMGDYYDHFRDIFVISTIVFLTMTKTTHKEVYFVILAFFLSMMVLQIGCQECNTAYPENNDCLGTLKKVCPKPELIHKTRYFGCGTFILVLSICVLMLKY